MPKTCASYDNKCFDGKRAVPQNPALHHPLFHVFPTRSPVSGPPLPDEARRFKRRLSFGAVVGAGAILALGIIHFRAEQNAARGLIQASLDAVADMKAGEISRWRSERLAEGRFLMRASFVARDIAALVARPEDPANRSQVLGWLEPIKGGERYSVAAVFDALGNVLAAAPASARHHPDISAHSRAVFDEGDSMLVDLHSHEETETLHMDLLVPVFSPRPPGAAADARAVPIALILLRLNPEENLFPMIQRWPTPSASAEAVLLRRAGDEVLYLNELRHQPGAARAMHRSIHDPSLPGAMAVRGETGVNKARDYRGVAVLSASRAIPDSPWFLVAKIDLAEVDAPARREMWRNGALLALLLGGLWVGSAVVWKQRQADYLRREIAERTLHERQVERLTRLYAALSHINQAIVRSTRREDIFREVCRVLVEFGRFRMVWIGWRHPTTEAVENVADFGDDTAYLKDLRIYADERPEGCGPTGTAIRENRTYVCNDFMADPCTEPWRAAAARAGIRASIALPVRVEGRAEGALTAYATEPSFFGTEEIALLEETAADIAFALDNFEKEARRREIETALSASEARYRSLIESSLDGFLLTAADGEILAANPAACQMLGRTEEEIRRAGYDGVLAGRRPTGRAAGELTFVRANGTRFDAEVSSSAFATSEGDRMSLIFRDITVRKQADAQLEAQLGELRRWHSVTVDRESRVLDLKREVNALLVRLGEPSRYASVEPGHAEAATDSQPKETDRT